MAGIRKRRLKNGRFLAWYMAGTGKQKFFAATTNRAESLAAAMELENQARLVRLGVREPKKASEKHKAMTFAEAVEQYTAWGAATGGRGKRGWAKRHLHYRRKDLGWWAERLNLQTLGDLDGSLFPKAEQALIELGAAGSAGKTLRLMAESLKALCKWLEDRNYLDGNPVKKLGGFNAEPRSQKRLLTLDELRALLAVAPPGRKLFYQTAACTGLRVSELRGLKVSDLNLDAGCLNIRAEISKSRKPAMLPIPTALMELLRERAAGLPLDAPLLDAPGSPQDAFNDDLRHAGIVKFVPGEGVACLHGLRIFYITTLLESGANPREAMTLARHADPNLTMGRYAKTRPERLHALAEQVGKVGVFDENYGVFRTKAVAGAEAETGKPLSDKQLPAKKQWWAMQDLNLRLLPCEGSTLPLS